MTRKKIILGTLLIILSFFTLFIAVIPTLYSNNSAGKIEKEIQTNFTFLEKENSEYILLYFGYVGCPTICTPALNEISQIYKQLDKKKFQFFFVNLLENTPKDNVEEFAKVFNKDFKGIYLNNKEIREVVSTLNVKFLPSIIDKYELDHSGFLYVLKKEKYFYTQKFLYTTRPFDIKYIIKDLNNIKG